jgi:hypothetical protein
MSDWADTRTPDWLTPAPPPPGVNQVPDPDDDRDRPTPLQDELVRQLTADEITGHNLDPTFLDKLRLAQGLGLDRQDLADVLNIDPRAAPPLAGSTYTVTVANPTPPTNVVSVACGTPPHFTMVANPAGRGAPTYSDDCALMATAALTVPAMGAITAIATPVAGSSGPTSEATGTVVIVTAPGSVAAAPTQSISVQGAYTTTPNASHPSSSGQPVITSLSPSPTPSGGGTLALTVNGARFTAGSVVTVGGISQTSAVINQALITVAAAPRRATAGITPVRVLTDGVVLSAAVDWVFT